MRVKVKVGESKRERVRASHSPKLAKPQEPRRVVIARSLEMAVAVGDGLRYSGANVFTAMGIIRTILWVALFLASTFAFTVLFEHGTDHFSDNAQKDWESLVKFCQSKTDSKPGAPTPDKH